ncbi:MAG: chorismate-binding protein, partial [Candidatus Woesearchaeota archaeon]
MLDNGSYAKEHVVTNCALALRGTHNTIALTAHSKVGALYLKKLGYNTEEVYLENIVTRDFLEKTLKTLNAGHRFCGMFGAFGYEFGNASQGIPTTGETFCLHVPSKIAHFSETGPMELVTLSVDGVEDSYEPKTFESPLQGTYEEDLSIKEFKSLVADIKEDIYKGRFMQCVLSRQVSHPLTRHPFEIYKKIRQQNPSPYCFYANFGKQQLLGASPEMHVKVKQGIAEMKPIAGTIRRSKDPIQDYHQSVKLLTDPKEISEHTMLVDLERNDMYRFCEAVQVDAFATLERYPNLFHIVSHLSGAIKEGISPL